MAKGKPTKTQVAFLRWIADGNGLRSIFGRMPRGIGFGIAEQCMQRGWVLPSKEGQVGARVLTDSGRAALEEAQSE